MGKKDREKRERVRERWREVCVYLWEKRYIYIYCFLRRPVAGRKINDIVRQRENVNFGRGNLKIFFFLLHSLIKVGYTILA